MIDDLQPSIVNHQSSIPMMPSPKDVTQLLLEWSHGDRAALEKLMPLVYDERHRLAERYLRRERPGHTLQATALVHEAYLRLVDQTHVQWQNRAHFFGVAANLMRQTDAILRRPCGPPSPPLGARALSQNLPLPSPL